MTDSPKVSILSAVHNEEVYIEEMIASVQAQSLTDWELIFCDDGSTDKTHAIARDASSKDARIRIVGDSRRKGKVAAFNEAYRSSRGNVVILLAGDDRLPPNSLRTRYLAIARQSNHVPVVAFFKIRTVSESSKFDNIVLPRRGAASRSGGSITMNRKMADLLFPIDESLASEDIWLSYGSSALAAQCLESTDVVLEYRIHPNNSNPRHHDFPSMSEAMHARQLAFDALLNSSRLLLPEEARETLMERARAEALRYRRRPLAILTTRLPLADRLAIASMANPTLYRVRTRHYRLLSGWRGR